ncbi:MAG: hypothetical protein ACI9BW_004256 [Gammaproteobacteria bacterium]|jgi:hypothetical protein
MNWDAIGAVSEIVGAIAVVVSLVYLAVQIRQSTRTERSRAFQEIFAGYNAHNHEMFGPNNIDLVIAGMLDIDALSGGERLRFGHLFIGLFNGVESTIFSKGAYLLGDETLDNWGYLLRTRFFPYPGIRDWWAEANPMFAAETCEWIEKQISATDVAYDLLRIK